VTPRPALPLAAPTPHCFEFYFPQTDTLVQVERQSAAVIIRASRNTFTEQRKRSFVRELAAEGFIPDDYQWLALAETEWSCEARWLVDISWLTIDPALRAATNRFMLRLLAGGALVWLGLMTALLTRATG
jgi:hypothetical protein